MCSRPDEDEDDDDDDGADSTDWFAGPRAATLRW